MLQKFYRIIAWVCIIAQLNLVLPSYQMAYAMGDKEEVINKALTITPEFALEEIPHTTRSTTFIDTEMWEKAAAFTSVLLLASWLEGVNPIYPFLSCVLFDKLIAPASRMIKTYKSIISSPATLFLALHSLINHVAATFTINGGKEMVIPWTTPLDQCKWVQYNETTAPFLRGVNPDQTLTLRLSSCFSDHPRRECYFNYSSDVDYDFFSYLSSIIRNSTYNISVEHPSDSWLREREIYITAPAKTLERFLNNFSFSVPPRLNFLQEFLFFNKSEVSFKKFFSTQSFLHLESASRRFGSWIPQNPPLYLTFMENPIDHLPFYAGLIILTILAFRAMLNNYWSRPNQAANNTENNQGARALEHLECEEFVDYSTLVKKIQNTNDRKKKQNIAIQAIENHSECLRAKQLFNLGSYVQQEHPSYPDIIRIQVDCLDEMLNVLGIGENMKDVFLQKLSTVETLRRQDITWLYIQKYQKIIRKNGVQVLFALCSLIDEGKESTLDQESFQKILAQKPDKETVVEDLQGIISKEKETLSDNGEVLSASHSLQLDNVNEKVIQESPSWWNKEEIKKTESPSRFDEVLSLQAKCLLEILQKDPDAQASPHMYQIKMDTQLATLNDGRQQSLCLTLLKQSDLADKIKLNLCDKIPPKHPRYYEALVHKAHLIVNNPQLSPDEHLRKAMRILFNLPENEEIKSTKRDFIEQYLICMHIEGPDFEKLKTSDPKNHEELEHFLWGVKKSLETATHKAKINL